MKKHFIKDWVSCFPFSGHVLDQLCITFDLYYRCLGQSARSAVAEYLQILSGGEGKTKKITLRTPAHPSIEKALEIVRKHFRRLCLEDQGRYLLML